MVLITFLSACVAMSNATTNLRLTMGVRQYFTHKSTSLLAKKHNFSEQIYFIFIIIDTSCPPIIHSYSFSSWMNS